jgi:cytochrome c peroxidase
LSIVTFDRGSMTNVTPIDLGGDSVRDTGHDLFHLDAGSGVACASCHAEGGEDGHVWTFTRLGLRRTQALHVGLEGTAPFHWAGDESDLNHLMSDVFVGRMGGVFQSDARVAALTRWLFALQPPAAPAVADASAVERGQAGFQSPETGCSTCHSGPKLTNNRTVDVGTGEALQVPSLRGIAYRAPFMHNGCARTLRDRFDTTCGGKTHGNTGDLLPTQLDDLLAYLQTL